MVRIPNIKIPSVRVGSIVPTSNIGAGGATPAPPTPITYLTQWKIVGNSEVHTDPYLTSWKVSGNSVVQDSAIMSCGDLGQDGKYHVKISNGATIFDIPLTEPLRKVNAVADSIEFPSDTEGKALVTRNIKKKVINPNEITEAAFGAYSLATIPDALSGDNNTIRTLNNLYADVSEDKRGQSNVAPPRIYITSNNILIRGTEVQQQGGDVSTYKQQLTDFYANGGTFDVLYALATPTTELIDVFPFPVSSTDTYTSANAIPYSAFEHTENKEIWSCGEYNATDRKYHILVQPQGGSIADITLTEPLRKVNNVADTIEFPSDTDGKALVTRNLGGDKLGNFTWNASNTTDGSLKRWDTKSLQNVITASSVILTIEYTKGNTWNKINKKYSYDSIDFFIYDNNYNTEDSYNDFIAHINNYDIIYELATPTTELVDAPQIEEADSYSMVISQGGKAVSWSSFETDRE